VCLSAMRVYPSEIRAGRTAMAVMAGEGVTGGKRRSCGRLPILRRNLASSAARALKRRRA
jgi:hypothetical protein